MYIAPPSTPAIELETVETVPTGLVKVTKFEVVELRNKTPPLASVALF
jgi:hypothetical protein